MKLNLSKYEKYATKYPVLIIASFAVLAFLQSITFGWVMLDDKGMIEEVIKVYQDPASLIGVFTHEYARFFRPLQILSFTLESYIAGENPAIYHIVNLILHSFVSVLVFKVLLRFSIEKRISLILSIVFAVHPVFSHAVAWIPSRGDLLLTFFTLLSFLYFQKISEECNIKHLLLHNLFFLLALFSKESAVILPILIFIFVLIKERRITKILLYLLPGWIISMAIWYFIRSLSVPAALETEVFGFVPMIGNIQMVPELIGKFIIPFGLSTLPGFSTENTILGILVLLALIVLSLIGNNQNIKYIVFGMLWYILFLVPALLFRLPHADVYFDYFEHRIYLSSIGLIIIIAYLVSKFINESNRKYFAISSFAFVVAFFTITQFNTQYYKNGMKFWLRGIRTNPERPMLYNGLASVLINQRKDDQAEKILLKSIEIDPQIYDTHKSLAYFYYEDKRLQDATRHFYEAYKILPNLTESNINLAVVLNETGQHEKAAEVLKNAIRLNPENMAFYLSIIDNYKQAGKYDSAYKYLKIISKRTGNVNTTEFLLEWADHLSKAKDFENAIEKIERALEINPNNLHALNSLGIVYARQGNFSKALNYWEKILRIDPKFVPALKNFFKYYYDRKMYDKALVYADMLEKAGEKVDESVMKKLKGNF